jgi:hypothetical protein
MSKSVNILEKKYSDGKAITDVRIAVINSHNLRQVTLEKTVKIDTGFDAGFHIQESEISQLDLIGVKPVRGTATLAGDIHVTAYHCFGYLQKIGDFELPPPGIEITLVFQGNRAQGLLGMEAISNWVVTFDGPANSIKITN